MKTPPNWSVERRIKAYLDVRGDDECWLWRGYVQSTGYPMLNVRYKKTLVSHLVLELDGRPQPPGLVACHTCDVRHCLNPKHLRWDTYASNSRDMVERGRNFMPRHSSPGERNGMHKLTWEKVRAIRKLYSGGKTQYALAAEFGVSQPAINAVISNRRWKEVHD